MSTIPMPKSTIPPLGGASAPILLPLRSRPYAMIDAIRRALFCAPLVAIVLFWL
jgi:hypothetical protein